MAMEELEALLAEVESQERGSRKLEQAELMYQAVSAIYNMAGYDGRCVIEKGGPTWDVLCEIVNYVEGWK